MSWQKGMCAIFLASNLHVVFPILTKIQTFDREVQIWSEWLTCRESKFGSLVGIQCPAEYYVRLSNIGTSCSFLGTQHCCASHIFQKVVFAWRFMQKK